MDLHDGNRIAKAAVDLDALRGAIGKAVVGQSAVVEQVIVALSLPDTS